MVHEVTYLDWIHADRLGRQRKFYHLQRVSELKGIKIVLKYPFELQFKGKISVFNNRMYSVLVSKIYMKNLVNNSESILTINASNFLRVLLL